MEFNALLKLVGDEPIFESALLMAGEVDPQLIRLQLSRWVNSGRILQLRRGLYTIAPPYRKSVPHPFLVANYLRRASYVSLHSALAYYGLIPEAVMVTTSVTTRRPERLATPMGEYEFRHIKTSLFFGFRSVDLGGQSALIATPEKALLDLIYFYAGGESLAYLNELRLQNTEQMDLELLQKYSVRYQSPKMSKAKDLLVRIIQRETSEYEDL